MKSWNFDVRVYRLRRQQKVLFKRLERLLGKTYFDKNHFHQRIELLQQGYRNWMFGAKAGPEISWTHVFHEIAHAVEFGSETVGERGANGTFHFKNRTVEFDGQLYVEPVTYQACLREIRTWAIQLKLMKFVGCKTDYSVLRDGFLKALPFVNGFENFPSEDYSKPFATRHEKMALAVDIFDDEYQHLPSVEQMVADFKRWIEKSDRMKA